ncbi:MULTISPECIES: YczE/YyaS/YitT family protein [Streptococcus]|uniref:YitT family protein n=1 Tax=Streptococcus caledonicus TaxID=2614158 RepID=A0ABW0UDR4_9STRE|nr:DUF6198 family protein [Streptococcus sp. S784/96/1]
MNKRINWAQCAVYLLGVVILAAGITLNTKSLLGVSPVTTLPYIATVLSGISLGITSFISYCVMLLLQAILLGKTFRLIQLFQLIASVLTSYFIEVFDGLMPTAEGVVLQGIFLISAVVLIAIGASLMIAMQLIPNPADALADVIGLVAKKGFGYGKNLLDALHILLALIIGFLAGQPFLGIGIGTVIAMVLTGRVIALVHPYSEVLFKRIQEK